jgi:hypothetical protein
MEKRKVGILAALTVALLSGISGLVLAFAGGIPALAGYLPSMHVASLGVPGSIDPSNFALLQGCSCCLCIPIPLTLGFFALRQQAKS